MSSCNSGGQAKPLRDALRHEIGAGVEATSAIRTGPRPREGERRVRAGGHPGKSRDAPPTSGTDGTTRETRHRRKEVSHPVSGCPPSTPAAVVSLRGTRLWCRYIHSSLCAMDGAAGAGVFSQKRHLARPVRGPICGEMSAGRRDFVSPGFTRGFVRRVARCLSKRRSLKEDARGSARRYRSLVGLVINAVRVKRMQTRCVKSSVVTRRRNDEYFRGKINIVGITLVEIFFCPTFRNEIYRDIPNSE